MCIRDSPYSFTVGDGVADNIPAGAITVANSTGPNTAWVVTDESGNILGLPPMPSAVNFDGAGAGTCLVWHLAFEDGLQGAEVGMNANDLQGCFSLSNPIEVVRNNASGCNVNGGELFGGPFTFNSIGDGVADMLTPGSITLANNSGPNSQWVVTDDEGYILGLPPMPGVVNFDGAGAGTCLIWHLSFEDGLQGAAVGMNANDLQGCFSLSNPIEVIRNNASGCNANAGELFGGPFTFNSVGDGVADNIPAGSITVANSTGANTAWVVTDDEGYILGLPPMPSAVNFDNPGAGTCLIWHLAYDGEISGVGMGLNANDIQGCFSLSNPIEVIRNNASGCNANGGALFGGPFTFNSVGDGVADNIPAGSITVANSTGANTAWVVTDDEGYILGLPPMPSAVNFDNPGAGTCLIWHLAYDGEISGVGMGLNANDIQGCFSLSNPVEVIRNNASGCNVNGGALFGGPYSFTVGDGVADNIPAGAITVANSTGPNTAWVVTDDQGNILGLPPMPSAVNFDGAGPGVCLVWHLAFENGLQGAEVGLNTNDLQGCFSLSNPITVTRTDSGAGTCATPTEATITNVSRTKYTMEWDAVDGAKRYVIQFRIKGRTQWAITATLRTNSAKIWARSGLEFEYRLKTVCEDGESEYSPVFDFSTSGGNLVDSAAESRNAEPFEVDIDLVNIDLNIAILEVAPNPFFEQINVGYEVLGEEATVSIYTISGQKVFEQVIGNGVNTHRLEIGEIPSGILLLTIEEEGFPIINQRIVKQSRL